MFDFGKQNQATQEQYGKDFLDKLEEIKAAVCGHTEALKQIGLDKLLPEKKNDNLTFSPQGLTWDNKGYPYAILISSSAQSLTISYTGQSFTVPISAGFTSVAIPDGALVTSTTNFTALVIYTNTEPLADGQIQLINKSGNIVDLQQDGSKNLLTTLRSSSGAEPIVALSWAGGDNTSPNSVNALSVGSLSQMFNGLTWDRQYNNTQGTLLASAARTGTTTSAIQTNFNSRGVLIILNVTAVPASPGTGGLTVGVKALDPVSGSTFDLGGSTSAVTTTGISAYLLYPSVGAPVGVGGWAVKQGISTALPRTWTAVVSHGDAQGYTYSLGYALIN